MNSKLLYQLVDKPITGEWGQEGGLVKVIRTANFTNQGVINFSKVVQRDIADCKVQLKKLQKNDIIIEKSGGSPEQPVGRVVFFDCKGTFLCNNFTSILRPKSDLVYPKYLHYILFSNHKFGFVRKFQNKTTGIINLQLPRYIKETKIPLPPLPEQKKIAVILDAADQLKQKDQQLIEHYNRLSQSLFLDMFGDPVTNIHGFELGTIRDLVDAVNYGTSNKAQAEGEYPYLRMNNITYDGYMDFKSLKYIDLLEKEKVKFLVKKGDVLFNRTNSKELVGKTGMYNEDSEMAIAGYLIRVRTNERANPAYIWRHLNSKHTKQVLSHMCKSIVGMANINAQELQKIKILIPPITLQNQFAEHIAAIEAQKQQAQLNLKKSTELFNSLLQRAFLNP